MKKLFLWTFILTLLCTWAIAGTVNTPTVSNVGPKGDIETMRAAKDKAAQEMQVLPTSIAPTALLDIKRQKQAEVQQAEPGVIEARGFTLPEKAPSTAPAVPPDPNVILQGGDRCEDATLIPSIPYTDNGTTCGYNNDYDEVCPYTGSTSPDVVYSYTPEVDICVDINTCLGDTDYDNKIYVYEDVCQVPDDGQEPYACNDDACTAPLFGSPYNSALYTLHLYAGHTYYIVMDGYGSGCGNYTVDITEVPCPVDPCENAIYHNGAPDWVNGLACDRRAPGGLEAWVVDDVELIEETHIGDIHWWGAMRGSYDWQNTDDYIILADAGGVPGAAIYEEFDVWNVRYATGEIFFGDPVYVYSLYVDITLGPGLYWMGFRPVNQGSLGQCFWPTAPLTGYEVYFRSAYFGYPNWVPGYSIFGIYTNVAFCLTDEPPPTGACCDDATGECIDYVSVLDCPEPLRFAANTLCENLDPPCGMACVPDFSVTAPVVDATGTTCGAGDDCDLRSGEDIIFEVEIPNDGEWTFSLCNSDFDTYMFVGTTCCGQEIGYNDDYCGVQSQLTAIIPAGTYYVDIEGYSGCGNYVFNVWESQCEVECPPEGYDEGEPTCYADYIDMYNGGCNSSPYVFQDVAIDDIICGESGVFDYEGVPDSYRDTDWYRLELTTTGDLSWTVEAEFYVLIFIINGGTENCLDYTILGSATADECVPVNLTYNVGPGVYWLWVGPADWSPLPCGPDAEYVAEVNFTPTVCDNFVTVEIYTDDYPGETTWDLVHVASGATVGSGGPLSLPQTLYTWDVCVDDDPTGCYQFTIYDAYGDGISLPPGYYNVYDPTGALVCTGGDDFGSAETCLFGTCVGACCVAGVCIGDMSIEECEAEGGTIYVGESCDDPDFTCPIDCENAFWHNGEGIGGAFASQCDTEYPMQAEVCDDFVVEGPVEIGSIVAWVGFWNADPLCTPGDVESFIFDIYNDAGGVPGGNPVDMDPDCAREGDIVWTHEYAQGEFGYMEEPPGYWRIWVTVEPSLALEAGNYWFGVAPRMFFSTWGQGGPQPSSMLQGSPCLLYFPLLGYTVWTDVWGQDMAFCLNPPSGGPGDCVYIPGDCNHDGTPIALDDVIAMIGMYRGTVVAPYTCSCPPHGDNFAPTADPDGDCTAFALSDVVREIAAYRGTAVAEGCEDCPGSGPLAPRPDGTSVIPSMKSKVKTTQQGSAD